MRHSPLSSQEEEKHVGRLSLGMTRRLLRYALPYRKLMAVTLVLVLLVPVLDLAGTIIVKVVIDGPLRESILTPQDDISASARSESLRELWYWAAVALGVMVVYMVARYIQGLLMATIGQRVMRDVRMQIFEHLQRMPLAFYDRNPVGRLVTRLTNDVEALNQLFTSGVVTLLADIILLSGITVALFYFSVDLALVTIAVVPFLLVATFIFRFFARRFYRDQRSELSRLNAFTNESLQGVDVIHLFTRESDTEGRYESINRRYLGAFLKTVMAYSVYFPVLEILTAVGLIAILWQGSVLMSRGALEFGTLFLFWRFLDRFTTPIRDMAERYNVLQAAMAAAERIFDVLDEPEAIRDPETARRPERLRGEIRFENVSFSYNGRDVVLRDFDIHIQPGETVAIVGATGSGKSTVINLLSRFYDPQEGRVLLDGTDVREISKRAFRRRFAAVLQDPFIFSRTVLDNITLRHDHITEAMARDASRRVNADAFIRRLPDGYHTQLRERGGLLSVGERQLLSFARALAHDPDVLILDEATSHVDTETERLIQAALQELLRDRTSIVIAHRLSTIQRADRILVLHKGELREQGRHHELLAQRGIYHRLYQLQFLGDERPSAAS